MVFANLTCNNDYAIETNEISYIKPQRDENIFGKQMMHKFLFIVHVTIQCVSREDGSSDPYYPDSGMGVGR